MVLGAAVDYSNSSSSSSSNDDIRSRMSPTSTAVTVETSSLDVEGSKASGGGASSSGGGGGAITCSSGGSGGGRSPQSLVPPDEHVEIAVQEAESKFLQGDFKSALKQANRCLTYVASYQEEQRRQDLLNTSSCSSSSHSSSSQVSASSSSSSSSEGDAKIATDDNDCFRPTAPLRFPVPAAVLGAAGGSDGDADGDQNGESASSPSSASSSNSRRRQVSVRIDVQARSSDLTDRAAAVALQSWYELRKMEEEQKEKEQSAAARHEEHGEGGGVVKSDDDGDRGGSDGEGTASSSSYRFLEPFWRAYAVVDSTGNNSGGGRRRRSRSHNSQLQIRSCSLELVVVLIKFCIARGNVHGAMELALATLHHVFNNHEPYLLRDKHLAEPVQELIVFLFDETLPFCQCDQAVSEALSQFKEPMSASLSGWKKSQLNWEISPQKRHIVNVNAARKILLFLENPPIHWPEEFKGTLGECQEHLDEAIEEIDSNCDATLVIPPSSPQRHQEQHQLQHQQERREMEDDESVGALPMSCARDEKSGRYPMLPTLGFDGSFHQHLYRVLYLLRVAVVEPLVLSENRWENRTKTAVTVWTLWMSWKQRRRLYGASKATAKFLAKPLLEIIEALIPRRKK